MPNAACPYRNHPGAPWQHMFSGMLRLSALTELETAHGPYWNAPDLDRLVSSCGCLQKLSLRCTTGLQLSVLLQLSNLVQLWMAGKTDKSTMASLAQLSGLHRLQRLAVTNPNNCRGIVFRPLKALTQLTYLALPDCSRWRPSMQQRYLQLRGRPPSHIDRFRWPSASCSVITSTVSEWHGVEFTAATSVIRSGRHCTGALVRLTGCHEVLACVAFLLPMIGRPPAMWMCACVEQPQPQPAAVFLLSRITVTVAVTVVGSASHYSQSRWQ